MPPLVPPMAKTMSTPSTPTDAIPSIARGVGIGGSAQRRDQMTRSGGGGGGGGGGEGGGAQEAFQVAVRGS
eukprot:COSAG04_NODE_323_length_16882_cov_5.975627_26_plen_71_part_00